MRMLVYEYFTTTGLGREPDSGHHMIYREGRAIRDAVVADCTHAYGSDAVVTLDSVPVESEKSTLQDVARSCDVAFVIAPERRGLLLERCRWLRETGTLVLAPTDEAIQWASDKWALAHLWRKTGIPTPETRLLSEGNGCFPVVIKPRDGAGAEATYLVTTQSDYECVKRKLLTAGFSNQEIIIQDYVPGISVSVSFICYSSGCVPLLAGYQVIGGTDELRYRGGVIPVADEYVERCVTLGKKALSVVQGWLGFVGVDMILGPANDGNSDVCIEINPRFTTSYLGLSALARNNLCSCLIGLAHGAKLSEMNWKNQSVLFNKYGELLQ